MSDAAAAALVGVRRKGGASADASLDVETTLQAWSSLGSLSEVDQVAFSDPRAVIYAWGRKRRG